MFVQAGQTHSSAQTTRPDSFCHSGGTLLTEDTSVSANQFCSARFLFLLLGWDFFVSNQERRLREGHPRRARCVPIISHHLKVATTTRQKSHQKPNTKRRHSTGPAMLGVTPYEWT